jgi:hypothetical protein
MNAKQLTYLTILQTILQNPLEKFINKKLVNQNV